VVQLNTFHGQGDWQWTPSSRAIKPVATHFLLPSSICCHWQHWTSVLQNHNVQSCVLTVIPQSQSRSYYSYPEHPSCLEIL
jgi:hypothetical protein